MKKIIISLLAVAISLPVIAEQLEDALAYSAEAPASSTEKPNNKAKPKLEDFASYNDFLKAMYLYRKNEEETIKPNVDIKLPASAAKQGFEYTPLEGNKDITLWGEDLPSEYVIIGE